MAGAAVPAGHWRRGFVLTVWILGVCAAASAQQTNALARPDFAEFKLIAERNVFDATRRPHRAPTRETRQGPVIESVSLVGTLISGKGTFAFFDGTSSEHRKAVEVNGAMAGYKVAAILPDAVKLESGSTGIEMRVGAQLRHDPAGGWRLATPGEPVAEAAETPAGAAPPPGSGSPVPVSGGDANDVLQKLQQQREQELK